MAGGSRRAFAAACALAAVAMLPVPATLPSPSRSRSPSPSTSAATLASTSATGGGRLPDSAVLHVTVTLRPRNPAALTAYATAVSTPGASLFHRYLSPGEFAQRFGAAWATVLAVRRALRARGLRPGRVSAGRLSIPVTAGAASLERGLGVSLRLRSRPGRGAEVTMSGSPSVGVSAVQSILGLNGVTRPRPLLVRSPGAGRAHVSADRPHAATGGPQPCGAAQAAAAGEHAYTADQIASAYGFPGLYRARDSGAGMTIAVYELEPVDPSDLAAYQSCFQISAPITYVPVDGGAGRGTGSGEAALDIENLVGLAPGARLLVYQGPNSNSGSPGAGPYDTFSAIINQDRAPVVSVSWGECETALGAAAAASENTLFEQAAVQGQTIIAAAGDTGAQDCDVSGSAPRTELAVDDPSSQPFVTGVGGTTLSAPGPRPSETTWNDGGTNLGLLAAGAGGGGLSALWRMPPAQRDAAPTLNILPASTTGAQCGNPGGYCREVPDVSANADPNTGYAIYFNGSGRAPGEPRGWQAVGGTSAAVPVWAAVMALAQASRGCSGMPIGYALPSLYRAAGSAYQADFNDARTGNNDFTGTAGGQFAAALGYDEATGLGSPNAGALVGGLCAHSLRLLTRGDRRAARSAQVSLRVRALDSPGAPVRLRVMGLPPGLRFDTATDRVTGAPWRLGSFDVSVLAHDGQGSAARERFTWTVGAATRVLALSELISAGGPSLAFTVAAGQGSPRLSQLVIKVPRGLRLRSAGGVSVTAGGLRPSFRARYEGGLLTLSLRRGHRQIRVMLGPPGLTLVPRRTTHSHSGRSAALSVTVLDTAGGTSRLGAGGRTGR